MQRAGCFGIAWFRSSGGAEGGGGEKEGGNQHISLEEAKRRKGRKLARITGLRCANKQMVVGHRPATRRFGVVGLGESNKRVIPRTSSARVLPPSTQTRQAALLSSFPGTPDGVRNCKMASAHTQHTHIWKATHTSTTKYGLPKKKTKKDAHTDTKAGLEKYHHKELTTEADGKHEYAPPPLE